MKRFQNLTLLTFVVAGCASRPAGQSSEPVAQQPAAVSATSEAVVAKSADLQKWCDQANSAINGLKWQVDACEGIQWEVWGNSVQGRPLVYASFGTSESTNTTLIFSMVHGDEVTPFYLALKHAHWMKQNISKYPDSRVVIAPLVNPDSFYSKPRTRTNARGVDVNRNLPTADWDTQAIKLWKKKFSSNPRRFPGKEAGSEPETAFQVELIKKVQPQKMLSIHAPLNFMDYDGPTTLTLARFPREYVRECLKLRSRLKAVSGGFFPGSLGNYAGQERGIPTLTLELPTANPDKAEQYWRRFSLGIQTMIEFTVPDIESTGPVSASGS